MFIKKFAEVCYFVLDILTIILIKASEFLSEQYKFIWSYLHRSWFDHRFDYLRGIENYYWYERAILAQQKIKQDGVVLDIGCGDGIYSGLFYSAKAKKVEAIDMDKSAIQHAKKYYSRSNVNFKNIDIHNWLKKGKKYDTVVMFSVIEHLSVEDGTETLKMIGKSLNKNGSLFGSTPLFSDNDEHNFEHQNEFSSELQLRSFLKKTFRKVDLYISIWPYGRKECYFECKM